LLYKNYKLKFKFRINLEKFYGNSIFLLNLELKSKTFQHESCRTIDSKKLLFWLIFEFQYVFLVKSRSNTVWPQVHYHKFIVLHKPQLNSKIAQYESCRVLNSKKLLFWPKFEFQHKNLSFSFSFFILSHHCERTHKNYYHIYANTFSIYSRLHISCHVGVSRIFN
jgi:hypothetical protein